MEQDTQADRVNGDGVNGSGVNGSGVSEATAVNDEVTGSSESSDGVNDQIESSGNGDESDISDSDDGTVGNTTFETTYETGEDTDHEDISDTVDNTVDTVDNTIDTEEEPPRLKYSRLNGLPSNFFARDPISSSTFHDNCFIFATHSGLVHISRPDFSTIRTFKAHRASVLSIYTDGKFFATGSMDGTIVIGSIADEEDIIAYDFKRPIHAVVLDKNYGKTRSFISGGMAGKVIHSTKNWLGQRSDQVLDEDNGPVVSIQVIDDIVIWMNDKGISVFHTISRLVIKVIEKPEESPRSDLYWPRVHFLEIDRILICWANYIWCLRVSVRSASEKDDSSSNKSRILPSAATISFRSVPEKKVEIENVFKLDTLIAGISSYKDDYWMVLSYEPPSEEDGEVEFNYPDLKLINSLTGEVDFEEEIGLRNIDNLGLNDYSLGRHIGADSTSYFIVSAKDGVIAKEFQLKDRLDWFIKRDRYKEAWDISEHLMSETQRLNLGIQHVDNLIKLNDWDQAAAFLGVLLSVSEQKLPDGDTKSTIITARSNRSSSGDSYDDEYIKSLIQQWENWSFIFIRSGHIELLTSIIPVTPKLALSTSIYDDILSYWLAKDTQKFTQLVEIWDIELYDMKQLQQSIETKLENEDTEKLRRTLIGLYVKSLEPQKAVSHLIHLKEPSTIHFLADHHLLTNYLKELPKVIRLQFQGTEFETLPMDQVTPKLQDSIDILLANRHEISPPTIVKLMDENHMSVVNYLYLEGLRAADDYLVTSNLFGNKLVELYCEFNRSKLLPYLMRNDDYDIDRAIRICEANEFVEELVYLLGKIGESRKALMLIINKLNNPEIAINFAKHQNDKEAWDILLDYSMSKPKFIKALIECADDLSNPFYDPISIIQRIPNDVKVEGLKDSVVKISDNNELNLLLNQLILKIIYNRSENISATFRRNLLKGLEVNITSDEFKKLAHEYKTILLYYKDEEPVFKQGEAGKGYTDLHSKLMLLKLLQALDENH